ncbi:MAG: glycosyltransferase [Candidatus Krumholzibacteriia bacterium]
MILSVVIPTRNKAPLLRRTLAALAAQQLPDDAHWEIVVVDDASSDGTADLLAARERAPGGPLLQPVRPARNLGRAGARNLGVSRARGRYLVFLDDDIVAPPGLLAAHLRELSAAPARGTIGYAVTEPTLVDAPHFFYLDGRAVAKLPPGPAPARYFVTQNAGVPREAFLKAGGFDQRFGGYGFEDMEAGFRLEDAGLRFTALLDPVPRHVHHHTLQEYLQKKRECGRDSLQLIAALHPHRLAEMRLDLVVDPPGGRPSARARALRSLLDGPGGAAALAAVERWPTAADHRPRGLAAYARAMDLAVLTCFRRGLGDGRRAEPDLPT